MHRFEKFTCNSISEFRNKAIQWLKQFEVFCMLDSHSDIYQPHIYSYSNFDLLIAAGTGSEITSLKQQSLSDLDENHKRNPDWLFGFLSYDLKNKFEKLESNNPDFLNWPDFYFFSPQILISINGNEAMVYISNNCINTPEEVWKQIENISVLNDFNAAHPIEIKARMSKKEYVECVNHIKEHIHRGDLYEINFCQEFYTSVVFDAFNSYKRLSEISPTPFSSFFRYKNKYLLCASPERFLKKQGKKLISQPIKGTTRRGGTTEEDVQLISEMLRSSKEQSENIMIVDLVRNDLSRISVKDSVTVDELCGVYGFRQVNQMISTITSACNTESFETIIRATFPMGSMTGAPKIKALQLAEKYESTKRGLYSGAIGYITPENDFDLNVVIRSLQYNSENNYLSYMVGGAITSQSDAENEYQECLLKASALNLLLKNEK